MNDTFFKYKYRLPLIQFTTTLPHNKRKERRPLQLHAKKSMTSFYFVYLEDSASIGVADLVDTRLVHSQRDAVEENDGHTDPLEPRVEIIKS